MGDSISRQAAIDEIRKCRFVVDAIEKIRGLPSAEPRVGRWIKNDGHYGWHCSECGQDDIYAFCWNDGVLDSQDYYCPNCGADMRGDGNETD